MKKTDRKRLDDALDKALAPPRKMPKQALDNLLDEYDDPTVQPKDKSTDAPVPEYRSTEPLKPEIELDQLNTPITSLNITAVPEHRGTPVPEKEISKSIDYKPDSPVIPKSNFYRKANEVVDQLDRELTPAESKVFDHLIRLSVGFNKDWCQVRISTLQERTGYRSDKTVRSAINGLIIKGRIARRTHHNNPLGDEYQIRSYSGNTEVPEYRSTPAENTQVLESKITGQLNTDVKEKNFDDDAALAELTVALKQAAKELTGKDVSSAESARWRELAEVLVTEAKIAGARTTVSSFPAFLAEHLRRRLWKKDKSQLESESRTESHQTPVTQSITEEQIKSCPDCGGSNWYYPEGQEKGIKRCRHEKFSAQAAKDE